MAAFTGPTYCEVEDVISAMTSYNSTGTPGEISADIVQLAIEQASAKVSSYTNNIWGWNSEGPIPVPYVISSITINIAAYYATLSYRKNKPLQENDPVILRYNDAIADLKAIQTGQIQPDPNDPSNGQSGSGSSSGYSRGAVRNTIPRVFTGRDSNTHISNTGTVTPDSYPSGTDRAPWLDK
jgi:phage gp36-like protein